MNKKTCVYDLTNLCRVDICLNDDLDGVGLVGNLLLVLLLKMPKVMSGRKFCLARFSLTVMTVEMDLAKPVSSTIPSSS